MNNQPISSAAVRNILASEFPPNVINSWEANGIKELLPIQLKAIQLGCLKGVNCLIVAPTSSGKTFVGEIICLQKVLSMQRALYLVPFKALAEEKLVDFERKYLRPEIGARILLSTGDRRAQDRRFAEGDFNIAILTYEKLSNLLVNNPGVLAGVGALVIDEVQLISDETRGAELEILLTRVKQLAPSLQIVGLSAVVSSLNGLDAWLGMKVVADDHRPVRLREGVITAEGRFDFIEWSSSERVAGSEKLAALSGNTNDDLAISLIRNLLASANTQILAFVNTVDRTQSLAHRIAEVVPSSSSAKVSKETISALEETDSIASLISLLEHGVAFHNADLTIEERMAVEEGFRAGEIRCLVSTSTLSMGVNLPASTVVIVDHEKWTKSSGRFEQVAISVAEYRNMSGRAGRFGLVQDDLGRSFLVCQSPIEAQALLNNIVHGKLSTLESALLKQPLGLRLLRIIGPAMCDTKDGIVQFLMQSFAATHLWTSSESLQGLDQLIESELDLLIHQNLIIKADTSKLQCSPLGKICAASGLSVQTFAELVKLVASKNVSPIDLELIPIGLFPDK